MMFCQSTCSFLTQQILTIAKSLARGYPVIHSCDGCTAHVAKYAQIDFAVLIFTTSTNISVLTVPLRKLLTGYIGKQTLGKDDTYLHFLGDLSLHLNHLIGS